MKNLTFEQLPDAVGQLYSKLEGIEKLLQEKTDNSQIEVDQLLTIKQVAELLTLSIPTIYGLVSKREIPVSKRGKRLYFSRIELIEWVKSGRKMTNSEMGQQAEQFLNSKRKSK